MRSRLGSITLVVSTGWADVTEDGPLTLVRQAEDATGALQFSVALYESGREPGVTLEHLEELLRECGMTHRLGEMFNGQKSDGRLLTAAGSFRSQGSFWRVWYVSDGRNVALVTYNTSLGSEGRELADCESMVASLAFPPWRVT